VIARQPTLTAIPLPTSVQIANELAKKAQAAWQIAS
jgi:hypothetical protein